MLGHNKGVVLPEFVRVGFPRKRGVFPSTTYQPSAIGPGSASFIGAAWAIMRAAKNFSAAVGPRLARRVQNRVEYERGRPTKA